jgi:hypothetical protein
MAPHSSGNPGALRRPAYTMGWYVGLSEIERQILLRELAEIAADLAELQRRAVRITSRLDQDESERLARPA